MSLVQCYINDICIVESLVVNQKFEGKNFQLTKRVPECERPHAVHSQRKGDFIAIRSFWSRSVREVHYAYTLTNGLWRVREVERDRERERERERGRVGGQFKQLSRGFGKRALSRQG